jgi:hypothetical protein
VRRAILDTLERIMRNRADLRKAARRAAKANCHPNFPVWWKGRKPRLYDGLGVDSAWIVKGVVYRTCYHKRNVAVPAAWLLARLGKETNVKIRVQRAVRNLTKAAREWEAAQKREAARRRAARERQRLTTFGFSLDAPDTVGWRGWRWDGHLLLSPVQGTLWHDATLRAVEWADSAAVRGVAGIHARRLPIDWLRADPSRTEIGRCDVHGIVERFGRYVLGTEGWRAEWVVIRELMAPDTKTALALMQRYPEVKVHIQEQETIHEDR